MKGQIVVAIRLFVCGHLPIFSKSMSPDGSGHYGRKIAQQVRPSARSESSWKGSDGGFKPDGWNAADAG